jgi:transcriptional regulator with XRE-family HTH domain
MTFGEKVQQFRKNNGLSQEQLAEKCSVSRQAVSKWESGQGYPEMEKVLQLCDLLKVDLDYLLRDKPLDSGSSVVCEEPASEKYEECNNVYKSFVGKWVKIFLNDKGFQGLYQVAVIAVNNNYIIFESNLKRGVIKISDIKTMIDAGISKRKAEKMQPIKTMEISEDYNPYKQFIGSNCNIKLNCNSLLSFPQGYYDAKINSVAEEGIIIEQSEKSIAIKISDVLMVIENSSTN